MSRLVVLGATGSIGGQALEVADRLGLEVAAVAARSASPNLIEIAARHPQARIGVAAPTQAESAELSVFGPRLVVGSEALAELAALPGTVVVNGIVGAAGLAPSVAALEAGNTLALANKESLVAGGPVVLEAARRGGGVLIPVDSEHSAIYQCLLGEPPDSVRRLILTASGGPFLSWSEAEMAAATPQQALAHPTWAMGPRISIDSATLMNKAMEVIEAHYLFGLDYDAIDVVIHPQSIAHSMVEFIDGSIKAQMGEPDMRGPIQYALTHPERRQADRPPMKWEGLALTFDGPDRDRFPCLALGYDAGRAGGSVPAVLNAADEVAVHGFLEGRIGFDSIAEVVARTLSDMGRSEVRSVREVLDVDREARAVAYGHMGGSC